jgi:CRISPR-associated protein Cas8a1/Csx13
VPAADAALQAQVRLRGKQSVRRHGLPGCYAMTLMLTTWNTKQKSRVATIHIPPGEEKRLDMFEVALAKLPPKVVVRTSEEVAGHGKKKVITQRKETFRVDSVIRPLVAENLAVGRPWYAGFGRLLTAVDANGKPLREKLSFERKGLHDMINTSMLWDHEGEAAVVQAVHEALRSRYGVIADENRTNQVAMRKRFDGEYDRWRFAFAGAKTADQFRTALCDLFSRGGSNKVLRASWRQVLPMIDGKRWQLARDLALLALASYVGKDTGQDLDESDNQENN